MKKLPLKTVARVIEQKVDHFDLSARDIASNLWLSERTVSRIIKNDLAKIGEKSSVLASIIDRNSIIQFLSDKVLFERLVSDAESFSIRDLLSIRESAFTMNQTLTNSMSFLDEKELSERQANFLQIIEIERQDKK